jgi:hypothetical protein
LKGQITMPRKALTLALAGASIFSLAACGQKVLDPSSAEKLISGEVEKQVGATPKSVSCPDDMEAKKGATYDCTLTAPNGDKVGVKLTMTNDEGRFRFEVTDSVQPAE